MAFIGIFGKDAHAQLEGQQQNLALFVHHVVPKAAGLPGGVVQVVAGVEVLEKFGAAELAEHLHPCALHLDADGALFFAAGNLAGCLPVGRVGGPGDALPVRVAERLLEQPVRKAGDGDGRKIGDGVDTHLGVEDRIGGGVKFVQRQKITAFPFFFLL